MGVPGPGGLCSIGLSLDGVDGQHAGLSGALCSRELVTMDIGNPFLQYFYLRFLPYKAVELQPGVYGQGALKISYRTGDNSPNRQFAAPAAAAPSVAVSVQEVFDAVKGSSSTYIPLAAVTLTFSVLTLLVAAALFLMLRRVRYESSKEPMTELQNI